MKTACLFLLIATFTIYIMRKGIRSIANHPPSTEDQPYLIRMLVTGTMTSTALVVVNWLYLSSTGDWPPHMDQFDGDWPYWHLVFTGGFGFCVGSVLGLFGPRRRTGEQ